MTGSCGNWLLANLEAVLILHLKPLDSLHR